jgi:thiosulfate dehydrogenase
MKAMHTLLGLFVVAGFGLACEGTPPAEEDPVEFTEADEERGGALYDKWWSVLDVDEPTEDHPLWAERPDLESNTRTGSDTWRCKECHGWDYLGVDGAYGDGSHKTGFPGIAGTTLAPQALFDLLAGDHGLSDAGLSDDDIWDATRFTLTAVVDVDDFIAGDAFSGDVDAGEDVYGTACLACHGADGLTPPPGADEGFDDFVGAIAVDNPWELLHKIRFGQPGSDMPPQFDLLSDTELADLGAFAQSLPVE